MSVLSIFKVTKTKSFDLNAVLASWPDAPTFLGKRKKDKLNIEQWLDAVAAGCKEREVEEKHWPTVARALLGEKALERLEEFERVLATMQGRDVAWTWERFRVAMTSMGWDISKKKTRTFTIAAKKGGLWWIVGRKDSAPPDAKPATTDAPSRPQPKRKQSLFQRVTGSAISEEPEPWDLVENEKKSDPAPAPAPSTNGAPVRRKPVRAMSDTLTTMFKTTPSAEPEAESETINEKAESGAVVVASAGRPPAKRASSEPVSTTITHAPDWLLGASGALEFLTSEYPKAMTTLSAILITAGSIPAFAATGGAAVLGPLAAASHGGQAAVALLSGPTAQAMGAIAVGLGNWLKAQSDGQVTVSPAPSREVKAIEKA